jgi:histidinol-phosphate aminotransferase
VSPARRIDPAKAARPGVSELTPYEPGRPDWEVKAEYGLDEVVKLASNESPLAPPPSAVDAARRAVEGASRYPDSRGVKLKERLAERLGVEPSRIMLGNGAEECIRLVAGAFVGHGRESVIPEPAFDAYETAVRLLGGRKTTAGLAGTAADLDDVLAKVGPDTDAVWICTPNNPTCGAVSKADMDRFLALLPDDVVVVMDEAYREFVTDPDAARADDYFETDHRVVGLRTFSKAFALAGLRVGYLVAHADMVALMERVRLPFNVGVPAQAAALAVMDDEKYVREHVELIVREREFLREALAERGLEVPASQTNFLFFAIPLRGRDAFGALMAEGVIVKSGDIWGRENHLRVTVGLREQNLKFLSALDKVLAKR